MQCIADGIARPAGTVRTALHRDRSAVTCAGFINLRLAAVEQHQQACVIGLTRIVDNGILQVGGGDRGAAGEVRGVGAEQSHGISTVLQGAVTESDVHTGHGAVADGEVTLGVGREAVEIKSGVRLVVAAIEEDHYQAIQGSITGAAVEQLHKLCGVRASLIGIDFVDDHVQRRRRARRGTR